MFSGNERTGIPFEAYAGWDHAADQLPKIPTAVDLDVSRGGAYRYDVWPTPDSQTADQYQYVSTALYCQWEVASSLTAVVHCYLSVCRCVGWSSGTTVSVKQNGVLATTQPLNFMEAMKVRQVLRKY